MHYSDRETDIEISSFECKEHTALEEWERESFLPHQPVDKNSHNSKPQLRALLASSRGQAANVFCGKLGHWSVLPGLFPKVCSTEDQLPHVLPTNMYHQLSLRIAAQHSSS